MRYFIKTPRWLHLLFPQRIWEMDRNERKIYLSFDDGPHPEHTIFVLNELKKYNAKATFFCVGKNVKEFPELYQRIIDEGHSVGNHTYNHVSSKNTSEKQYMEEVAEASQFINSRLFRPPYGELGIFREKLFTAGKNPYLIIMWTVLSGDFDPGITPQRCLENVLLKGGNGSIVVFHDSEKAATKMRFALPAVLKSFTERGFNFEKLEADLL